jgi:hypothetical protein
MAAIQNEWYKHRHFFLLILSEECTIFRYRKHFEVKFNISLCDA